MASILGFFSVSPACAGMIPADTNDVFIGHCEPRMRGDDPSSASAAAASAK